MTQAEGITSSEIRQACRNHLPESVRQTLAQEVRRLVSDAYRHGRRQATQEIERAKRDGWAAGFQAGAASAHELDAAFLRVLVTLCHPDLHPGRAENATKATQRLLSLLECRRSQAA